MIKHLLFGLLLMGSLYYYWETKPVEHGPGIVAPDTPEQQAIYNGDKFDYKEIELTPKAEINLEARVLSIEKYYFDKYSDLTSTDIVFGWGPMSDERNLNSLMVRQSDRSFYWEMAKPPIQQEKMWQNAANMHLIGSTDEIKEQINFLREGHIVELEGYLVDAKASDWTLETSLSRSDIGSNSSELVWIKSLTIL